jgi:hypothetical protein
MGGIGAGMICMEGTGALSHVSIKSRPDVFNESGIFAAVHVKGILNGARLLEGPVPDWKKFGRARAGNGLEGSDTGLPRFRNAAFLSRFPFGYLDISDPAIRFRTVSYKAGKVSLNVVLGKIDVQHTETATVKS